MSGEFHGQRSLEGCSPQGRKESDTTEQLTLAYFFHFHLLSFNSSFSHFCFLYYGFPQASQNFCKITIILYSMLSKKLKSVTHTCFVRVRDPSFLSQWRRNPSQALPKLPGQPGSPGAQKETENTRVGEVFLNLSPSVSKSIKSQVISLERIALCSLYFILSVSGA